MVKQLFALGILTLLSVSCTTNQEKEYNLIVGCNVKATNNSLAIYRFDAKTGKSKLKHTTKGVDNATFQAVSTDSKKVYTFSEIDKEHAKAYSYAYDSTEGSLSLLNTQLIEGDSPCFVWVDANNSALITANYGSGSISFFPLTSNGEIEPLSNLIEFSGSGADAERQSQPHLHSVYPSPDEQFLFANDLGTDRIYKFEIVREKERIVEIKEGAPAWFETAPGDGPRHSAFHPNGKYLYTLGEISGMVTLYNYDKGNLTFQKSFEADSLYAKGSADIHISSDGKFLYTSNRLKGDGIAIFSIEASTGELYKIGYQPTGTHPRNFAISPDGNFLLCANRDDNQIEVFRINKTTGMLTNIGQDISIESPVCVTFTE